MKFAFFNETSLIFFSSHFSYLCVFPLIEEKVGIRISGVNAICKTFLLLVSGQLGTCSDKANGHSEAE